MFVERHKLLQSHLEANELGLVLLTNEDSVYYFSGFYDYLHMDFGRPTILAIKPDQESVLLTPMIELEMAQRMTTINDIIPWQDGEGSEWRAELSRLISEAAPAKIGIDMLSMPPIVRAFLNERIDNELLYDIDPIIAEMRMIKSAGELRLARHAGEVGVAMMQAGRDEIASGIPEFEVALAVARAGSIRAAGLLSEYYEDPWMSPNTHFLQIMASGSNITMAHHRPTLRQIEHGDPIFLCLCGTTNFHRFKLGFDRTFWLGEISNTKQEDAYQLAVSSQQAALDLIRPGALAEDVHAAYAEVIQSAGYDYPFRCGRATGFSFIEQPQLVAGDKTRLQSGMVLAIDGSVSIPGEFRAQVGDSVIVNDEGYELITKFSKAIEDSIVQ